MVVSKLSQFHLSIKQHIISSVTDGALVMKKFGKLSTNYVKLMDYNYQFAKFYTKKNECRSDSDSDEDSEDDETIKNKFRTSMDLKLSPIDDLFILSNIEL